MAGQVVIRADADSRIGIGHMMRCMALAQAFKEKGIRVTFISRCPEDRLRNSITRGGFGFIPVERPFPEPADLVLTLNTLKELEGSNGGREPVCLILDGYHFQPDYHRAIRNEGFLLIVIDDMAHVDYYHTDILINYNVHALWFKYACDKDTLKLLGTEYTLLRNDFSRFRDWNRHIPEKAKNIVITFGGSEKRDLTRKVLEAFKRIGDEDLNVIALTGEEDVRGDFSQMAGDMSLSHVKLLPYVDDMPSLLSWADLAVSACGVTSLEAAFMGLPSIVITVEKNQEGIGERLQDLRVAQHLGEMEDIDPEFLAGSICDLIRNQACRREMSENGRKLVDGKGSERVCTLIHSLGGGEIDVEKHIRMADNKDCLPLWRLANDRGVRQNSFSSDPIPLKTHTLWFENRLKSLDDLFFVLDIGGQICGQIRYSKEGDEASVHFSLAPVFRGRGLARKMIVCTWKKACIQLGIKNIKGVVKESNVPSIRTFRNAGFIRDGRIYVSGEASMVFRKACQ